VYDRNGSRETPCSKLLVAGMHPTATKAALSTLLKAVSMGLALAAVTLLVVDDNVSTPGSNAKSNRRLALFDPRTVERKEPSRNERPVIHTFFQPTKDTNGNEYANTKRMHDDLIAAWKELWSNAGYEPRVLTLDDAKKHPDYEKYNELLSHASDKVYEDSYDFMCFMRWFAMAAQGTGGWMSDYDTFPLNMDPNNLALPNYGAFTSYQRHVPALLSGSATEWDRMAHTVTDLAVIKLHEKDFYSDMLALHDLFSMDQNTYLQDVERVGEYPYKRIGDGVGEVKVDCKATEGMLAVHLAHSSTNNAIASGILVVPESKTNNHRHYFARIFTQSWKRECFSEEQEKHLRQ